MTHKLKAVGLALVAVFAISALAASAAQAEFTFTEVQPIILKSEQPAAFGNLFAQTAGKPAFKCEKSPAEGISATGDEAIATLSPKYENRTIGANLAFVTILPTTCHYRFNITGKDEALPDPKYTDTADIVCTTPGDSIHIQVYSNSGEATKLCEITIDEQNGTNGITYTNVTGGSDKDIVIDYQSSNIKRQRPKASFSAKTRPAPNTQPPVLLLVAIQ